MSVVLDNKVFPFLLFDGGIENEAKIRLKIRLVEKKFLSTFSSAFVQTDGLLGQWAVLG